MTVSLGFSEKSDFSSDGDWCGNFRFDGGQGTGMLPLATYIGNRGKPGTDET